MTLLERLNLRYMKKLFASPEGRAHVLAQTADGESSGESAIFTNALAQVDDPEWQRAEELRLVPRVDREAGGVVDRPIHDARGVLEAYALLQALEERAVFSFGMFIRAIEEFDPETARVMTEVLEDEKRHLKYCVAVSKRYAKSEEERLEVLARMRDAEARAFKENQMANMNFSLGKGWIGGRIETALWRAVRAVALVLPVRPGTTMGVASQPEMATA